MVVIPGLVQPRAREPGIREILAVRPLDTNAAGEPAARWIPATSAGPTVTSVELVQPHQAAETQF